MEFVKTALSVVLIFCGILVTILVVRRELFPDQLSTHPLPERTLPDSLWLSVSNFDTALGSESAPVRMVEYLDYECPFCRQFHSVLDSIRVRYPKQVAIVYRNLPLTYHPEAYLSAMAAECATQQSKLEIYQNLLFQNLEALSDGTTDRFVIAETAQISDMRSFQECMISGQVRQKIDSDTVLAGKLGIHSIPTLFVNGKMYSGAMTFPELDAIVKQELGK